jgi:large subunit ribosomal protein L6
VEKFYVIFGKNKEDWIMSRIGKLPVMVPKNVKVTLTDNEIKIEGPKGTLSQKLGEKVSVSLTDDKLVVSRADDSKKAREFHGLTRALINNMVIGVTEEFTKELQMIGVGYRAQAQGSKLTLNVGYSHPVLFDVPKGLTVKVEANTNLTVTGFDKQSVGLFASQIRSVRPPEPYKGKGIRYKGETVLRKAGKSGK